MSRFSLIKKTTPVLLLTLAQNAFAYDVHKCRSFDGQFGLEYKMEEIALQPGKKTAFFDLVKVDGTEFWAGAGSVMGKGKITEKELKLELTFTATGSTNEVKLGLLSGKKSYFGWSFEMVPYDFRSGEYLKDEKVPLQCREYER